MTIQEIAPFEVPLHLHHGAVFIDVREAHERASGMAEGARGIAKAELEAAPESFLPQTQRLRSSRSARVWVADELTRLTRSMTFCGSSVLPPVSSPGISSPRDGLGLPHVHRVEEVSMANGVS